MGGRIATAAAALGFAVAAHAAAAEPPDLAKAFAASLAPMPEAVQLTQHGAVYVPAYASIRAGRGRTRIDLAVTLSVHNPSETAPLVLEAIDYFDTGGNRVERPLDKPLALRPFGTIEVFVPADDSRGGSGANFLLRWAAPAAGAAPVAEAVMVGTVGTTSYSFVSQGRVVAPGR